MLCAKWCVKHPASHFTNAVSFVNVISRYFIFIIYSMTLLFTTNLHLMEYQDIVWTVAVVRVILISDIAVSYTHLACPTHFNTETQRSSIVFDG